MDYGLSKEIPASDSRQARWKRQREKRGWDDTETWNLDTTFAKFIIPRLKRYRKIYAGHPASLTSKKWKKIVKRMIVGFEETLKVAGDNKKIARGLRLFSKWYCGLWW